jgi:hypothetical protein
MTKPSVYWVGYSASNCSGSALTCPCIQAGFQSGDTSVEFHFVCSQALLFRFRCDDLCTQFPQAPQVTVEPLLSISLLAATVRSGEPYHEYRQRPGAARPVRRRATAGIVHCVAS